MTKLGMFWHIMALLSAAILPFLFVGIVHAVVHLDDPKVPSPYLFAFLSSIALMLIIYRLSW